MNWRQLLLSFLSGLFFWVQPLAAQNWAAQAPPYGRPDATIDLRTREGTQVIQGKWRYNDAKIVEVDSKGPGPDLKPSGAPVRTYDYTPHAGIAGFDDSQWPVIDPATLDAKIEKLAGGFLFTEGPVWVRDGGYLLFSDPNNNLIYRWSEEDGVSVYRTHSGYTGMNIGEYGQPGSNGLTLDSQGRLTINEHGNRRVTRLEKNGQLTVLADHYQGKRLNSPNDLVYKSDGALYFTDPPFGLPKFFDDPRKELAYSGVFRVADGKVQLLTTDLLGPNGLAFSPDEKFFYVDDWDVKKKVVMRYRVEPDGTLSHGEVFFDMTSEPGEQALDGMKVDRKGNLYVSGPGGVWIVSPGAKHLG